MKPMKNMLLQKSENGKYIYKFHVNDLTWLGTKPASSDTKTCKLFEDHAYDLIYLRNGTTIFSLTDSVNQKSITMKKFYHIFIFLKI